MKKIKRIVIALLAVFIGLAFANPENNKYFEIAKNIEIFTNLYKELNTHYVDDIDPSKLMKTGIDAMVESLDPFTNYISESQIEGYRFMTEGKYHGIGARVEKMGEELTIVAPYEDSPSTRAGLKAGDVILAIDGKSTKGKKPSDVGKILEGYPGTEIELTIKRPGESKEMIVNLERGEVKVPNVPHSGLVGDDIGYIALTTFTRAAGKNVTEALKELKEEQPELKGVILDLRGNGGGLLTEAINVSNVFIPRGELVVSTRGKVKEQDRSFKTMGQPTVTEIPLVILIDKGSASASEIVSGVIQDLDRGVLIGQRSYGKGLVQNTLDIGYNSKLKITISKYYIPSGRCIQSVSYKDGEPVDIPDEDRAVFQTRNGRKVLDGGGVTPDVIMEKPENAPLIKQINKEYLLFHYATEFCLKNEEIGSPKEFEFNDYAGFLTFLEKKGFNYQSNTEKSLEKLMGSAEEEAFHNLIETEVAAVRKKIQEEKKQIYQNHEKHILKLLEKEIVGRYFFEKGKVQTGLKNDEEIKAAIELLNDMDRYRKLLNN